MNEVAKTVGTAIDKAINIWDEFDDESRQPWQDYWDFNTGYGHNLQTILSRSVALPHPDLQLPILAAYTAVHSVACGWLPILYIHGATGTGKSLLNDSILSLRNMADHTLGSSSTFASIRNTLNKLRWHSIVSGVPSPVDRYNEKPYIFALADIKEFVFQKPEMYSLFRNGTSRAEDKLTISAGSGENMEFYVFGAKILSTADGFVFKPQYDELLRRCVVMETCHIDLLDPVYVEQFKQAVIDITTVNWTGIEKQFTEFWSRDRLLSFAGGRKNKTSWKRQSISHGITEHQFIAGFDLMLTYQQLFDVSVPYTVDIFSQFFAHMSTIGKAAESGLFNLLQAFTDERFSKWQETQEILSPAKRGNYPYKIMPKELSDHLISAKHRGFVADYRDKNVADIMDSLGYTQATNGKHEWSLK